MGDDSLEVINQNIQKYNENTVRILEERKRIKQKIDDIEIQKGLLEDYTDISKLEIEQADLKKIFDDFIAKGKGENAK